MGFRAGEFNASGPGEVGGGFEVKGDRGILVGPVSSAGRPFSFVAPFVGGNEGKLITFSRKGTE